MPALRKSAKWLNRRN